MPLVNIKLNEERLNPEVERQLAEELTAAVARVCGEQIRPHTWVVVEAVPPARWSVGGKQLSAR